MTVEHEHDALRFLELLYGTEPPGLILVCEGHNGKWKTHACKAPAGAVYYVLGNIDVYHRIGLVAKKPGSGRGKATDTTALTAVWLDIDVNGSPDGKGGVVTDGAPSREAATDLLRAVLAPTLLILSGYGVHGYWLLTDPWLLTTDEERDRAAALVRGWHERHKQEARARGMSKFDSVFDLARVLRPVGSLNGKGAEPAAVEFIDDSGPRYSIAQLQAEAVEIKADASSTTEADTGPGRTIETLLTELPKLAKIVARDGKAPGDGSGHSWDFYAACETKRGGGTQAEARAVIRHNRAVNGDPNGKAERDDYVDTTVEKAWDAVDDDETSDPARKISKRWGLAKDPILSGEILMGSIVYLTLRSGRRLRIPDLDDLFDAGRHSRVISRVAQTRFARLSPAEAVEIAQLVIELCTIDEPEPAEEARGWVTEFIAMAGGVIDGLDTAGEQRDQWTVLKEHRDAELILQSHRSAAGRSAIVRGESVWLPAAALKEHSGARVSWAHFDARLAEIGWRKVDRDVREKTTREGKAAADRIHRNFYVGNDE